MTDAVLSIKHLSKSFGAVHASRNVSLDLRSGEIHALIGPNGAGKSTLIQQIAGGLQPDAGQVILEGRDITRLGTAARARMGLGRSFQISELAMEDSVLQNAMLGALGAGGHRLGVFGNVLRNTSLRETAQQALTRVGLQDHLNTRAAALSHGQRRLLEIAIALTLRPKLFLMDEPMAGLGASGSKSLVRFLDKLRAQAPILLVEHDMDAVFALADRVSVLVYGQIIATGSVAEIKANRQVQKAYLGVDG